ncbi:hypothetical protein TRVL_08911 [Trypanosoma vivax]|nr:hypothetical protein TRVL_08911 [Trypanosoma vivax]
MRSGRMGCPGKGQRPSVTPSSPTHPPTLLLIRVPLDVHREPLTLHVGSYVSLGNVPPRSQQQPVNYSSLLSARTFLLRTPPPLLPPRLLPILVNTSQFFPSQCFSVERKHSTPLMSFSFLFLLKCCQTQRR